MTINSSTVPTFSASYATLNCRHTIVLHQEDLSLVTDCSTIDKSHAWQHCQLDSIGYTVAISSKFMVLLPFLSPVHTWQGGPKAGGMTQHRHRFSCAQILFPAKISKKIMFIVRHIGRKKTAAVQVISRQCIAES